MTDKTEMLNKIRKTLALANDAGATEQERETALRMAHALLAKHNLSLAQVEQSGSEPDERRGVKETTFYGPPWARIVAMAVAKLCFCEYVTQPGRRVNETRHYFIGRESNAVTASELSRYVIESIKREKTRTGGGVSFANGAAHAVYHRCMAMIEEAKAVKPAPASTGTALVLADIYASEHKHNRVVIAAKWHGGLRSGRVGSRSRDGEAYRRGQSYGQSVNLNRSVGGSRQKQIAQG